NCVFRYSLAQDKYVESQLKIREPHVYLHPLGVERFLMQKDNGRICLLEKGKRTLVRTKIQILYLLPNGNYYVNFRDTKKLINTSDRSALLKPIEPSSKSESSALKFETLATFEHCLHVCSNERYLVLERNTEE